jgi:acetylornithine deacetylase/succinyl-diaminopimelate desuccinylase-like protein
VTTSAHPSGNGFPREKLLAFAASERGRFETALRELVEIPTVSNDPDHRPDMGRGADYAADLIRSLGGEPRVIPTKGHPLVHGAFRRDPAFPTVTVYNHLDVQSAQKDDGWRTEPATRSAVAGNGQAPVLRAQVDGITHTGPTIAA